MKKYIRSERSNLFEPNVYISMVVKLRGSAATEDVRHAVACAYAANEATMSKVVLEENGDAYYKKMEQSGCKVIEDKRPWMELLHESQRKPFALWDGELIRTFLTKEDGDTILFLHAHHLVGDGKSILILIQDIFKVLEGETLSYKPMMLVDRAFLEDKAKLYYGVKLAVNRANRKWARCGKTFSWEDYLAVHEKYWSRHFTSLNVKTYDVTAIRAECQNGVTVNSYMIASMLCEHPEYEVVGIPVSIREDEGMSNQTSGISIKYKYKSTVTFEDNLRKIHNAIHKRIGKNNEKYFILLFMERMCPSLVDAIQLQTHGCYQNKLSEKMARIMGYIGDGGRDFGVTNLTRIDKFLESSNYEIKELLFIPPKVSYTERVIGVSTYKDTLTVCHHEMI